MLAMVDVNVERLSRVRAHRGQARPSTLSPPLQPSATPRTSQIAPWSQPGAQVMNHDLS